MRYTLTLFIFLCYFTSVSAQTSIKTDFLVIGATAAGIGAGVQASKCGIKTLIVNSTKVLGTDVEELDTTFTLGLDGQYLSEWRSGKTKQEILRQWLREQKALKVLTGVWVSAAHKVPDGWELTLSNGKRVLAKWVFEDKGRQVVEYQPGKFVENVDVATTTDNWLGSQYRTRVGVSRGNNMLNCFPLSRFVSTKYENWFVIPSVNKSFSTGQIVGAMAANSGKKIAKDFDVRAIQKVLFTEGLYLESYNDLRLDDPDFIVFQRIFAAGLLRPGFYSPGGMLARPGDVVVSKNIMQGFMDYYKSSTLWFERHSSEKISLAEALELISIASHKDFDAEIESEWNRKLRFTSTFDSERPITRREFAVLTDTYLQPFNIQVDMKGLLSREY